MNQLDNLDETDKFLENTNYKNWLKQQKIWIYLYRNTELVIKVLTTKKKQRKAQVQMPLLMNCIIW